MLNKIMTTVIFALPLAASATEYRTIEHPRQECWNERMPVQSAGSALGPIIGGIAGGILGNQVGGGNGKVVATAAGAMTGAVVGDRLSSGSSYYQTVQRCKTVVDVERVPVYRQPPPVVVVPQPVQVIEQRTYYVEPDVRYDVREHWDNGRHRGWYRHHHHDDDDDD
jgi:uncharacterized protein YcfJ